MVDRQSIALAVVEEVALALGELNKEVIYVGGAVVGLYVTDEGAEEPRPTKDIDICVQIASYAQMDELRQKLASKMIFPAPTESVIYRYQLGDILIDFIPFEETTLGPTNSWLKPGFPLAYPVKVGKTEIKILPVSLFLATKWEAYKNRGGNDPRMSHDFEDLIYVLDNNSDLLEDIRSADKSVRKFLTEMSAEILENPFSEEIIEVHLDPLEASLRKAMIVEKLEQIRMDH